MVAWQRETHAPHLHCDKLLRVLRVFHPELPKSTKTLVGTCKSKVNLKQIPPGKFKHFGIETGILETLKSLGTTNQVPSPLEIFVGIDGIQLSNSSSSQFWAIVAFISSLPQSSSFVVGVFHAHSKPDDSNLFLQDFIEEVNVLNDNGIIVDGECVLVKLAALICDAPARAMVLCTKGHTSMQHGCGKCTGSSINIGQARTNRNFRNKSFPDHHHQRSIVENINYFDIVRDVPLDPMHLIDMGVVKRLLTFLFGLKKGRRVPGVTLRREVIEQIDSFIISLRTIMISRIDFARIPRSLKEIPRWKATEFRLFLHYIGVVVLKPFLRKENYNHFLCLHVAIKLLSCEYWCQQDREYANDLLGFFVKQSANLYTSNFVSYNVHNLLHICQDVARFGPLYFFSAYRFENYYGLMKKFLKKSDKPLEQLVKRLDENRRNFQLPKEPINVRGIKFNKIHCNGPLLANIQGAQYKSAENVGLWKVTCEPPDNCVMLTDLSIVIVHNLIKTPTNRCILIGKKFLVQNDFFDYPIASSAIHEYLVSNLSPNLEAWDSTLVKCKAVKLLSSPTIQNNSFVVFPLMRQ